MPTRRTVFDDYMEGRLVMAEQSNEELTLRMRGLEIAVQNLIDRDKATRQALESREFHFKNRPRFDWRTIGVAAIFNIAMIGFLYYWVFEHKGLH